MNQTEGHLWEIEPQPKTQGCFGCYCFQALINKSQEKTQKKEEISVKLFDKFHFLCIPSLGVYGDDFFPCIPLILLQSSLTCFKQLSLNLLSNDMFETMSQFFKNQKITDFNHFIIEHYFIVHRFISPNPCQHFTCDSQTGFYFLFSVKKKKGKQK